MNREKQIESCENCLHYSACLINGEYVPTPCRAYEDKAGYRKQSEGEWITQDYIAYCSVCKIGRSIESQFGWKYCPNCGAKMKGV